MDKLDKIINQCIYTAAWALLILLTFGLVINILVYAKILH